MYYVLFVSYIFIYVHWSTILRHYFFDLSVQQKEILKDPLALPLK